MYFLKHKKQTVHYHAAYKVEAEAESFRMLINYGLQVDKTDQSRELIVIEI